MNTFYRKIKNLKFLIFLYELARETILASKYYINLIIEYVKKKSFEIKYRNTDFLYLTCLDKYYKTYDRVFNKDKLSKDAY